MSAGTINFIFRDWYPDDYNPTTPQVFYRKHQPEWFNTDFAIRLVKEIDLAEAGHDDYIRDRHGKGIFPFQLSHTTQTVLLMYNDQSGVYACSDFGENAWPFVVEMLLSGKSFTLYVNADVFLDKAIGDAKIEIQIEGNPIASFDEFEDALCEFKQAIADEHHRIAYEHALQEDI